MIVSVEPVPGPLPVYRLTFSHGSLGVLSVTISRDVATSLITQLCDRADVDPEKYLQERQNLLMRRRLEQHR